MDNLPTVGSKTRGFILKIAKIVLRFEPSWPSFRLHLVCHHLGKTSFAPVEVHMALNDMGQ